MYTHILVAVLAICVTLFGWEYAAVRQELDYSPSITLNFIATKFSEFFEAFGRLIAWISSFLTIFDIDDMYTAAAQLLNPIVSIFTSWFYFFVGYVSEMNLYDYPYLVTFGSIIIIIAIFYALYRFNVLPDSWRKNIVQCFQDYAPQQNRSGPSYVTLKKDSPELRRSARLNE